MQWVESSIKQIGGPDCYEAMRICELAARTCYRSEDQITHTSAGKLITSCLRKGHESVIEHVQLNFEIVCDRATSHQWVRHRLSSYSQESQRYCNYTKEKFNNEIVFVRPEWTKDLNTGVWASNDPLVIQENLLNNACSVAEKAYFEMIKNGAKPEQARAILPNCVKTQFVWSANMREIRHFIKLRATKNAQPEIRKLAIKLYDILQHEGYGAFLVDIEVYNDKCVAN